MHATVNTKAASGLVVLLWIAAAAAMEAFRPLSVLALALLPVVAGFHYLTHEPAPTPEVAWRDVFGVLILVGVLGVLGLTIGRNDTTPWMFVVLTYVAAGRLKDLIGDRRVYIRLRSDKR